MMRTRLRADLLCPGAPRLCAHCQAGAVWRSWVDAAAARAHQGTFSSARRQHTAHMLLPVNGVGRPVLTTRVCAQYLSNRIKCIDKLTGGPFLE